MLPMNSNTAHGLPSVGVAIAHGAGGDMNSGHLPSVANALAEAGFPCLRFTCKPPSMAIRAKAMKVSENPNSVVLYRKLSCSTCQYVSECAVSIHRIPMWISLRFGCCSSGCVDRSTQASRILRGGEMGSIWSLHGQAFGEEVTSKPLDSSVFVFLIEYLGW